MSDDGKYNGWANYATWRVNLEIVEDYANGLLHDEYEGQRFEDVGELATHLKEHVEEIVGAPLPSLAVDYATAFLSDVDWYEIAEHYPELIVVSDEDGE